MVKYTRKTYLEGTAKMALNSNKVQKTKRRRQKKARRNRLTHSTSTT